MNVPPFDRNRDRAFIYSHLNDDSQRELRADAAAQNLAASDEIVRRKLRRQRIIGSAIALLAFAMFAAYLIFGLVTR